MRFEFRTKPDVNGNSKHLTIDTDKKIYYEQAYGGVIVSRKDMKDIMDKVKKEGYREGIRLGLG